MQPELHISSLAVHALPARLLPVCAAIGGLAGTEVRGHSPAGKIVVVLETAGTASILERIEAIRAIEGVLSAQLVFHQIVTDPDRETGP